jgi:hypothetical protein
MPITVRCGTEANGHRCTVDVAEGSDTTHHDVTVSAADLERWARGRSVEDLVEDSFAFLLQREPKESILKQFDLSAIQRYFPDYDGAPRVG